MSDDGAGQEILARLESEATAWGSRVEFMDGGTQGLALLGKFEGRKAVVFLDAIRLGDKAGAVHVLDGDELVSLGGGHATTAHEGSAPQILAALQLLGEVPQQVTMVGIEPEEIKTGIGLSAAVEANVGVAASFARMTITKILSRRRVGGDFYVSRGARQAVVEAEEIGDNRLGVVELGGSQRQVFLDFIPEAQVGEYVLVHAGFAISRLEEDEARETCELLERIGMLEAGDPGASGTGLSFIPRVGVGPRSLRFRRGARAGDAVFYVHRGRGIAFFLKRAKPEFETIVERSQRTRMHEMSIATSVLEAVEAEAEKHAGAKVTKIGLRIGEWSGVDPDALRFCFEALAAGQRKQRTGDRDRFPASPKPVPRLWHCICSQGFRNSVPGVSRGSHRTVQRQ